MGAHFAESQGQTIGSSEWLATCLSVASKVNSQNIAAQRPTIFSGATGQMLSLFQGYQVNLMQQMFTHVAKGEGKSLAMMAAAQQTMFGLSSQPMFKYLNQHLIGEYDKDHEDVYTMAQEAGTLGSILMHGLPSNALGAALWSRGDTNPRYMTVMPTSLSDSPIVDIIGKSGTLLKDTVMAIGGPDTINQSLIALAHANINRPMTGLAETLLGKRISKGNELDAEVPLTSDLSTWFNVGVRLTGAKPLDEALMLDSYYRANQYKVADNKIRKELSSDLKAAIIAGNGDVSDTTLTSISTKYMNSGGSPQGFNTLLQKAFQTTDSSRSVRLVQTIKGNAQTQALQNNLNAVESDD
jgi:hypothetical protein